MYDTCFVPAVICAASVDFFWHTHGFSVVASPELDPGTQMWVSPLLIRENGDHPYIAREALNGVLDAIGLCTKRTVAG